jgi:hypothetical protein
LPPPQLDKGRKISQLLYGAKASPDMDKWRHRPSTAERVEDEMRRVLVGFAVAALAVLALAGPASAAPGQVTRFRFSGTVAEAHWLNNTATRSINTNIIVSDSTKGSGQLNVDQPGLAGATLTSGSALPATSCTFDVNFKEIGCSDTTIYNVTASWTGQGPLGHSGNNSRLKTHGFSLTSHMNGTFRDATATGTVGDLTLGATDDAQLGITRTGTTTICIGNSC